MGLSRYMRMADASAQPAPEEPMDEIVVTAKKRQQPVDLDFGNNMLQAGTALIKPQAVQRDYAANEQYIQDQIDRLTSQIHMMRLMSLMQANQSPQQQSRLQQLSARLRGLPITVHPVFAGSPND